VAVAAEPPALGASARTIMAGDRLRIAVAEAADLSKTYAVAGDGSIDFGYIGRVIISDLSVQEAEGKLQQLLEDAYFKKATVQVDVEQFVEGNILVLGAVTHPGSVAMSGDSPLTLMEAIATCGGLTGSAAADQIHIVRWKFGGGMERQVITVDISKMIDSLDFSKDQFLRPRDIIVVPSAGGGAKEFLALGEFASVGYHPVQEGMTVIRAIAAAGGVTREGKLDGARLIKQDKNGQTKAVPLDLQRLLGSGDMSLNFTIEGGDIIFVPPLGQSAGGKVIFLGAVKQPGAVSLPLDKEATLAKTILGMGGLDQFADGTAVEILRLAPDGTKQRMVQNVAKILKSGDFETDVPLRDGDVVRVPERTFLP
jgi:polysaccharide export outer membrane protein